MSKLTEKITLSIDPGYERLGLCVLKKDLITKKILIIHSECFKTPKDIDFQERLFAIGLHVENIINKYGGTSMRILINNSKILFKNPDTTLK